MPQVCSIEGCGEKTVSRGWCGSHYFRFRKYGDPLAGNPSRRRVHACCTVERCDKPHFGQGFCSSHYTRKYRGQDLNTSYRQRVKEAPIDQIVSLYVNDKLSTVRLAERFGIADVTISAMLKKAGVAIRGITGPRARNVRGKLDESAIVLAYTTSKDMSVAETARVYGTSISTIKNILVDNRVQLRKVTEVRHTGKWKRGSEHPFYKPHLTESDRVRRRSKVDVKPWRDAVFKRDRFECQSCGAFGRQPSRLEAHHIESWSTCPDKRFDVSNGITFCQACHLEFHKQFGKGGNDRLQLAIFLTPAMETAA